jgi:CRISPR-associated protein Csd2
LIKEEMVKRYYDIRMFGAVLTAGTNAGQVRGPMQLTFARSLSPVLPMDISITRIAITREADKRNKQTEMGRKAIIPYGLYRAHGFYSPKLAQRLTSSGNPISKDDMKVFWEAILNMFELDRSAARGEMVCRGLYIFSHKDDNGLGNMSAHKLFNKIEIIQKDKAMVPRSFEDYEITVKKQDVPENIELTIFD